MPIEHTVRCLWRDPGAPARFSTAVSLHSHTWHSRENLDFIPRVLGRAPVARNVLGYFEDRHRAQKDKPIPFDRVWWRPPLHPHAAYDLEALQIRRLLELEPLVSISDHDNLEACAELRAIGIGVPYSLEWTVPYEGTVFHIGVHNLPPERARGLESEMAAATARPSDGRVRDLLAAMAAIPEVLLVLNHPFSCEERVPGDIHAHLLGRFLEKFGRWFHALELNGLQPAASNTATIHLAASRGLPVISGGDRHCTEPNANVNLTRANTFAEFVQEVRDGYSTVLFLPQYRDPISARYVEFIWQAVRNYPESTGRVRWVDRVFYQTESGEIVSCAELWPAGGPAIIRGFISAIALLASPGIRAVHCRMMGRPVNLEPEIL